MFRLKPDYEEVYARFEGWWQGGVVDRPLYSTGYAKPAEEQRPWPSASHPTLRERWFDEAYVVACAQASLENRVFAGDALPVAFPNLGPEVFSAFYGCPLLFGESTVWSEPILPEMTPESIAQLRLDRNCEMYRKIGTLTDALLEAGRGTFLVGYTDLHGGGDALAAFRDPQNLLIDTIECPELIKTLCERITDDFLSVYDSFHERLSAAGMPSTTWLPVVGQGRVHVPSNDFSCMISEEAFRDLFLPGIVRECRHMDRCIYHLDGPQALRYLDLLLDIPEIQAIQWVPGAGEGDWRKWIAVYQQIQARGKSMQILDVPAGDLSLLFASLAPEGVWVSHVSGVGNREEADAVEKAFRGWTRKRG